MNPNYLDFEQPIADLEAKIQELRHASHGSAVDADAEVHALQNKLRQRTAHIFRDLSPWQVSQLARHPARPYTNDYIRLICSEFQELAGDRAYSDDAAIVGGRGVGRVQRIGSSGPTSAGRDAFAMCAAARYTSMDSRLRGNDELFILRLLGASPCPCRHSCAGGNP